jgi:hypothetical protein
MGEVDPKQQQHDCSLACYEAKSAAYDACRKLPLDPRAAKVACFEKADAGLAGCLNKCSAPSGAAVLAVAGLGLLVLEFFT